MARNVKIELNREGVRALLLSPEIAANLKARAERIAQAAGDGMEVEEAATATRSRFRVRTETFPAMRAEANDRALTRAIDAGR